MARRLCVIGRAALVLSKSGAFNDTPGAEEAIEGGLIADEAQRGRVRALDDVARNQDHAVDEAPEFHADVLLSVQVSVHHHGKPGFEVPGQGGDDHVGPVADQIIQGHAQGIDAVFELLDDVLLIAALVGTGDDLGGAYVRACRDIEEITAFVEQDKVALHFADVLAQDHDAIHTFTARRLVVELGHVFVVEDQVGVGPLVDDALFLVGLVALPLLVGHGVITGFALQGLPLCLVEGLSTGTHRRVGVHPEDEVDAFGPAIKMSGQGKVGVATYTEALGVGLHQRQGRVDPGCRTGVAGHIPRSVDQEEHFLRVGQ